MQQLLIQEDALRLAKETAIRSGEVEKADLQELYEKVALGETLIPEYFHFNEGPSILKRTQKDQKQSWKLRIADVNINNSI